MTSRDLLIEIGTEELPSKMLRTLSEAFGANVQMGLEKAGLSHGAIQLFVTPRRLALLVEGLATAQPSRWVERKGPALVAAYDTEGNPTPACVGFANSCGAAMDQLTVKDTDKGAWLFFSQEQPGASTTQLLPALINQALAKLPIPKPMRWGNNSAQFVRPVHWAVLLFGDECIETEILGQRTGRKTRGHRFHHPDFLIINQPKEYEKLLWEKGKVIASYSTRKDIIRKEIKTTVAGKGKALIEEDLLDEVTGLVEWPVALLGEFDSQFLEVPAEALISAMKNHQKCFSVLNDAHQLLPYFITISNIESRDPERVIAGNQRVIRARLADAQFFYHTDKKHSLEYRLEELKKVTFQTKLGTLFDKSQRIAELAQYLANITGTNVDNAARAGLLAKADLMTTMVGEFPELQGIMGYYYAQSDREPKAVALALREQYMPRFSGDDLPQTDIGCLISIADKIDTLVGIFGINLLPTGEKDPYALRRAALGVLRIIIEKQLPIDLQDLLQTAVNHYQNRLENAQTVEQTFEFMMERLRAWYLDRGIDADVFAAVLARHPTQPLDFHHRVLAVRHFQKLSEASALTAANKRVSNILKKQDGELMHHPVNPSLLEQEPERELVALMEQKSKEVEALYSKAEYTQALATLATLQAPIDRFFDKVMVMVEDKDLRNNRLSLLYQLRQLFLQVADISLLQV